MTVTLTDAEGWDCLEGLMMARLERETLLKELRGLPLPVDTDALELRIARSLTLEAYLRAALTPEPDDAVDAAKRTADLEGWTTGEWLELEKSEVHGYGS